MSLKIDGLATGLLIPVLNHLIMCLCLNGFLTTFNYWFSLKVHVENKQVAMAASLSLELGYALKVCINAQDIFLFKKNNAPPPQKKKEEIRITNKPKNPQKQTTTHTHTYTKILQNVS